MINNCSDRVKTVALATIVFAATLGIIAASLPDKSTSGYHHQEWVQPARLTRQTATPISSHEWSFDYRSVEGLVNTLATSSSGSLVLNNQTLERLNRIASTLPGTLTEADIERVGFLAQQGQPAPIADDLAHTLKGFLRYRQAERDLESARDGDSRSLTAQMGYERSVALQNRYLGEIQAGQLFGQQRRLQQYLIKRQAIQANPDLSAAQRQDALNRASERFKSGSEPGNMR